MLRPRKLPMNPPDRANPMLPAIVLAAGASIRLGVPKQLIRLPQLPHETLLERSARVAVEAGAHPVYVVIGAGGDQIVRTFHLENCRLLQNPEWPEGMASSMRLGIATVIGELPDAKGALLLVCDQPALSVEHLRLLIKAHRANLGFAIASRYCGRAGVPAIVPRSAFAALLTLKGNQGARTIFSQPDLQTVQIDFPGGEWDIDTVEDLEKLRGNI